MAAKTKKEVNQSKKVGDFGNVDRSNSKADQYWRLNGIDTFISAKNVQTFNVNELLIKKYQLKGLEFGNWLTIEDKWNYLNQLLVSLENLNKVLNFGRNIGLKNQLTISIGARGKGRALAHFEPMTDVINITRYKKGTLDYIKPVIFQKSGGFGSYAHEYGHFLDYFFGKYIDQNKNLASLTGGRTIFAVLDTYYKPGSLRYLMFKVLEAIMWLPGKEKTINGSNIYNRSSMTKYYKELRVKFVKDDYWLRQNEIFARAFEQYILFKLKSKKLNDVFLSQTKYGSEPYMSDKELKAIIKPMDALVNKMAKIAKS